MASALSCSGDDVLLGSPFLEKAFLELPTGNLAAIFAGTASISFGQSGALISPATLAGTATATFSQSAILSAPSNLSGNVPVLLGQFGSLSSPSAFSGIGPITFGQQGDFNAAIGAGAIFAGTASLSFGQSGNFSAGIPQQDEVLRSIFGMRKLKRKKQHVAPEPELVIEPDDDEVILAVVQEFMRLAA